MFNYESKLNNKILILTFISINIHFHDSPSYNGFFFLQLSTKFRVK